MKKERLTWIAVPLVIFAAPGVSAEIFKCAKINGMDHYQNFPCSTDSTGSLSGPTSATATSPLGSPHPTRLAAIPMPVASTGTSVDAGEPRIGMTMDETAAIWGKPLETDQDERKEGRVDIWRYADGRFVEFNRKQRVLAVKR